MAFSSNRRATYELVPIQSDNDARGLGQAGTADRQLMLEAYEPVRIEVVFDRGSGTHKACLAGLISTWIFGAAAIGGGGYVVATFNAGPNSPGLFPSADYNIPYIYLAEFISLCLNVITTALMESVGYIHAVSLRWALQREGRLTFNSNLRLFTSSRTSTPNSWFCNVLVLVCTVLAYACSASMFRYGDTDDPIVSISGIPVLIFGLALFGLASICTWALAAGKVPTWSSSPLDTVLACFHTSSLNVRPGRCMASVHEATISLGSFRPKIRQGSAWSAHKEVKRIVILLWSLVLICFLWALILFLVLHFTKFGINGQSWAFLPVSGLDVDCEDDKHQECSEGSPSLVFDPFGYHMNPSLYQLLSLIFYSLIQAFVTLGMLCAELQVNLSRDESFWRSATSRKGCKLSKYNSLKAAFTSWQSIILFISKAVIHWMFGLAAGIDYGLTFRPVQITYLAIIVILFACFSTYISTRKPKGPQPASYGHLQTLADLIDEWWPTIYWGHKSDGPPCHAGTSVKSLLAPIKMDQEYAGS